jgi:ribosome-associated translation inhibitor RaiA
MKSDFKHFKMLAFQSDYTNVNINNKIAKLEKDIASIESNIKVESIGNLISNLELINDLFSTFFNMVFNGLDIILSSINDKKLSNVELVFNKIEKYLNKIKFFFDNRIFYTQDVEKVLNLICEMKISYETDDTSSKAFDKKMISELLKETYNTFDSNKVKFDNIMCEFYESGRNINKTISSIYHMIVNIEENIEDNKKF